MKNMEAEFNNASVAKRTRAGFDRYLVAKLYGESGSRNRRKIRRIPDVELVTDEVEVVSESEEEDALPVRVEGCSARKGRGKKSPNFVLVSSPSVKDDHSDEDCWFVEQEEVSKLRENSDKCGLEEKCIRKGKEKILVYPSNLSGDDDEEVSAINSILQDDLLEQILVYLPIASIIRARLVCKKWREITSSKRFLWNASQTVQQKPWYFMYVDDFFTGTSSSSTWYAYDDPILQNCHGGGFLDMMKSHTSFDSSDGLVCFVKDNEIHVCNPITKEHKKLHEPPRTCLYHHRRLINIWVNRRLQNYSVSVLDYEGDAHLNVEISFQVYDSATMKWATSQPEILIELGWLSDSKSVICNGVLYFLIYSHPPGTGVGPVKYGLLAYNFSSNLSAHGTLINSFIPLPCSMIFGLMNLKEKLIIVGAIDKPGVENLLIGFGIWLLIGKEWQEISRITCPCIYSTYGRFDSSGADDLIYISNKLTQQLVVFDMKLKQWTCCQECLMNDVTNGFCFQPRLDISP
ncbi:unnamed protein product [Rhodiola kirilowii]